MENHSKIKTAPIELPTLNHECYKRIKEMILCGELEWGERVEVSQLAASFGISKFPVIKAIERLSLEKLVAVSPNRGTYVVSPTEEDVNEITQMRIMIEEYAIKIAFAKQRGQLAAALRHVEETKQFTDVELTADNFRKYLGYDRRFHMTIVEGTENGRLISYYKNVRSQAELFRTKTFFAPHITDATICHRKIQQALERGDVEQAIDVLRQHLLQVNEATLRSLQTIRGQN